MATVLKSNSMVDRWIVCWFSRAILNSCCSRSLASEKTSDLATCILLLVSRMYHSLHICDKDKSFRFEQIFIIVVTLRHIVTDHTLRLHWFLIKSIVLIKKIVDCNIIVCAWIYTMNFVSLHWRRTVWCIGGFGWKLNCELFYI